MILKITAKSCLILSINKIGAIFMEITLTANFSLSFNYMR